MYTNVGVQDIYVPVGAWNPCKPFSNSKAGMT